ncbi:MAG TPA: hypothetical protein VNP96_04155 [Solirubrobacterales bacterium]|nr:hypothetical protein [Solirubrobacterales bacterium]
MGRRRELGVDSVCCLLHNLIPGGSGWQWVHLLGRHVERGGRATICAPPGPLAEPARAAGIEVVPTSWAEEGEAARAGAWDAIERHDVAIVHWDHMVMEAFVPALKLCGRAALVAHQAPHGLARWFGPEILPSVRVPIEAAAAESNAVVLVRGEAHRRRIADAFEVPPDRLRILPASIPLAGVAFRPAAAEPVEVLAMVRLSPEKEPVPRLAIELVRAQLDAGRPCRLTVAGDGPLRDEMMMLCEQRLPAGPWRVERAPRDPIARLAAADLVVAQGLTTLEAAALGRRVVVAKAVDDGRAGGIVLTPDGYDEAARDPFGQPPLSTDTERLWAEALALGDRDLRALRQLVEKRNSLKVASRALGRALKATA